MDASLAARIDVAALSPGADRATVHAACLDARELGCASVCVPPAWVAEAAKQLEGTNVAVCGVVGFPLGATTTLVKVFEALECVKGGATELDIVIHVGGVRSGDIKEMRLEAQELVKRTPECLHKFILEMPLLNVDRLAKVVRSLATAEPAFLKTGTGTVGEPVRPAEIARLRELTPASIRLKAAGGIRDQQTALALVAAGADRLGTSSPRAVLGLDAS
jgi:deoxyribose-phosphate aldolase